MKRTSVIYVLMLTMILAGCSIEADSPDTKGDWLYDTSLPVPIEFGNESLTKAAVFDESDLVGKYFGVFAIDNDVSADIKESVYLENKLSLCSEQDGVFSFEFYNTYYYPLNQDETIHFYAYYPYTSETSDFATDEGRLYLKVTLGGTTDIMYSNVKAGIDANGEATSGFNAAYIRGGGAEPSFTFRHVTSGVQFRVKNNLSESVRVNYLMFRDFPMEASLCLVDKDESSEYEGTLMRCMIEPTFYLGGSDTAISKVISAQSVMPLYETIFVNPQNSFECELTVDGVPYSCVLDPASLQDGLTGHEPGSMYRYLFVIDSLDDEIVVKVEKDINE